MHRAAPVRRPALQLTAAAVTAALLIAAPSPAPGAEVTLTPSRDTSIYSGTADSNTFGNGAGAYLWLAVTAEGLNRRALVQFDLSSIPPGSLVREARFALYESRARDVHQVSLHRLTRSWGEAGADAGGAGTGAPAQPGDATWVSAFHPGTAWAQPGGDFDALASASASVGLQGVFYAWGPASRLTADVQAWVTQPALNHGWILIGEEQRQQSAKRFESRENTAAANRPRLTVLYDPPSAGVDADIPVPAWALWVLGGALLAALGRHQRGRGR